MKAAEAAVAGLEKNRMALGQELGQAQTKVAELASRVGVLEQEVAQHKATAPRRQKTVPFLTAAPP